VATAVEGATAVVNAVSLYAERGPLSFAAVHEDGAERVAQAAARAGATWLVHVSGIGAEPDAPSRYARSRARGEERVRRVFPDATIVRPSVMIGPDDALVAPLARLARLMPAIPMFGGGTTRLQPVLVDDVATAIAAIVVSPDARGATYELGGPAVYTFAEIARLVLARRRVWRPLVPVPFAVGEPAAAVLGLLPNPPVTVDAIRLLRRDNVVRADARGFADLAIVPTAFEEAVARALAS
jgi:NADH dehydrogenase